MPDQTAPEFAAPDPLDDKYELGDELGRGGIGRVHHAKDRILGRDVAVKFLHERHVADDFIRGRFVEEAQIGGQLQHPGVVPVYDLGRVGDELFFAMKLVEGDTLASQLAERSGPEDRPRHFLSVFESVCQTIAFAHTRGVIHRDLKPENVMIGAFGEVQVVVDWGFGKLLGDTEPSSNRDSSAESAPAGDRRPGSTTRIRTARSEDQGLRSQAGSAMGTPAYMPKEQALGDVEDTDERSDVFSLGAILCEMLTGSPPYTGFAEEALIQAATARLDDARERLAKCHGEPAMVELALDCLQGDKAARPKDARVLADRVQAHLAQAEARLQEARIQAAQAEVRATGLRRMLALGAVLLVAILGGLFTSLHYWRAADKAAEEERAAKAKTARELERSEEIRRLVTSMLDQVTPEQARTADTKLLKGILAKAAERLNSGGVTDPVVAGELHFLVGRVYKSIGQYPKAMHHLELAASHRERALGESHNQTIGTWLEISEVLIRSGDQERGEQLHRKVIADFERLLGPDHEFTLTAKLHGAIGAATAGRYREAEEQFVAIREPIRTAFGTDHDNWALMQASMAGVFALTDRQELAEPLAERAHSALLARHGETHPTVVQLRSELAVLRRNRGDFEGALEMLQDCVRIQSKMLGPRHPDALDTLSVLGRTYEEAGQLPKALEVADLVIERSNNQDQTAPARFRAMHDRMLILRKMERLDEAAGQGQELLQLLTPRRGDDHEDTLGASTDLGAVLLMAERNGEALILLEATFSRSLEALGARHSTTQTCAEALVHAYLESDRRAEAGEVVRTMRRRILADPNAPPEALVQGARSILANPAAPTTELEHAVDYVERAMRLFQGSGPEDVPSLLQEARNRLHGSR